MKAETFTISGLSPAEFRTILLAHGWFDLSPFKTDVDNLTLEFPYDTPAGRGRIKIAAEKAICQLTVFEGDTKTARAVVNHCLSLDMDVAPLYVLVENTEFDWIAKGNYGRYLRGCTLFEDCFKIMLTTNIGWSNTKIIVQRTIDAFGRDIDGVKAFPLPNAFDNVSAEQLQKTTGCGYRAEYLLDLCNHAVQAPDLFTGNDWKQLSGDEFTSRLKIKGLGPICVTYLCRFYGKPGKFTIDARVLGRCDELWKVKKDTNAVDAFALKRYQRFGDYAASVFWFEITRYWHEQPFQPGDWWKPQTGVIQERHMNKWEPREIIVHEKVRNDPVTTSILSRCPNVSVKYVNDSKTESIINASKILQEAKTSMLDTIIAGKQVMFIAPASDDVVDSFTMPDDRMICPHFERVKFAANGCFYQCDWCYLKGTYRAAFPYITVRAQYDEIKKQLQHRLDGATKPIIFSSGEVADSLSMEHLTGAAREFIPWFGISENGYLFMLTKSDNVDDILALPHNNHTIISWSMNNAEVSRKFEIGAPAFERRLEAARKVQQAGYPVRIRIDPIVPIDGWREAYAETVKKIFEQILPDRITIGTLRFEEPFYKMRNTLLTTGDELRAFMNRLIPMLPPMKIAGAKRPSKGKYSFPEDERVEMFDFVIKEIRKYSKCPIALCKDSEAVWNRLGLPLSKCSCVCQLDSVDMSRHQQPHEPHSIISDQTGSRHLIPTMNEILPNAFEANELKPKLRSTTVAQMSTSELDAEIIKGVEYLRQHDPIMAALIDKYGSCGVFEKQYSAFETLGRNIICQQVSMPLGDALVEDVKKFIKSSTLEPIAFKNVDQNDLFSAIRGLTIAKASCIIELARRINEGELNLEQLALQDNETIFAALLGKAGGIDGIGDWTIKNFLIYYCHQLDVLLDNDAAIKSAARRLYTHPANLSKELSELSERWSPYRTIAQWYLIKFGDDKTGELSIKPFIEKAIKANPAASSEYFEHFEYPTHRELFPEKLTEFTASLQELVPFPVDALPKIIRDYIGEVAASRQVPVDLPAILALGAIAIPAMGKFHVHIGNTHDEPINIYAVCVMPPGTRKSPTFQDVMAPVYNYETEIQEAIRPIITKAKAKYDLEGEEIKALKKMARSAKKSDVRKKYQNDIIDIMTSRTVIPTEPNLTVNDVTPARVGEMLAQNKGRIAIIDSEGSGVVENFTGRNSNIDVYLKGHSGDTLKVARLERSASVKNPAITIIITIQPDVMNTLAKNKIFRGRGLLGRFLYSIPESLIGNREYKNISINEDIKTAYNQLIKSIFLIPELDQQPYSLVIADKALDTWKAYANDIETKQKPGGIFESMTDWASKHASAVARIAGLIHVALNGKSAIKNTCISPESVKAACEIGRCFQGHALIAYGMLENDPNIMMAHRILDWIQKNHLEQFTQRDCQQAHRHLDMEKLITGLKELCDRGYIAEDPRPRPKKAGRPSIRYYVRPPDKQSTQYTQNTQNVASLAADNTEKYNRFMFGDDSVLVKSPATGVKGHAGEGMFVFLKEIPDKNDIKG